MSRPSFWVATVFLSFLFAQTFLYADTVIVNDTQTQYVIGIQDGSDPCWGTCDLSPSYNGYTVSSAFAITKVTFQWYNYGGNNCDGIGNYGAVISNVNNAGGVVATSTNTVYLGCAGFGGGESGGDELDFGGDSVPSSFYLDFLSFDGGLQGGVGIVVYDVEIWTATGPPVVSLGSPYLLFPAANSPLQLAVTNSGSGNLVFSTAPSIVGYNASDFSVNSGTTCVAGATIAPSQSCLVNVSFTPLTTSWEIATLVLFDNASYSPQTVPLSGNGPLISISPDPVPGSTGSQTITITGSNFAVGKTIINWQDLTQPPWTGTAAGLALSSNVVTFSGKFEEPSAIWQIEVVNPGPPATTSNWYPFQVVGTGVPLPAFMDDYVLKNAPFDTSEASTCPGIDADYYGFCSRECVSYVTWRINRDNGTTDTSNPSFFNGMAGGTWGSAPNWNANATNLNYQFDAAPSRGDIAWWGNNPTTGFPGHVAYVERANSDGSVDVSEYNYGGDDGGVKHQYGLRHLTLASQLPNKYIHISRLSLNPTSLDFGNQAAGTSASQTVTVTNSLSQAISVSSATVGPSYGGVGSGDFAESDTCNGVSLSPGAQCSVTVTFSPPSTLTVGSSLSAVVVLDWGVGPQLLPVKGVALTSLNPFPGSLSLGQVTVGQTSAMKTVTLTNRTGGDLTISSVTSGSSDFTAVGCAGLLVQGASCTVNVTFSPTLKGVWTTSLTIVDTAVNSPQVVKLSGTGI